MISPNSENFLGGCRLRCGLVVSSKDSEGAGLVVSLGTREEGGMRSSNVMFEEEFESCLDSCAGCMGRGFFEGLEEPMMSSN
jgi:hypothetical protein